MHCIAVHVGCWARWQVVCGDDVLRQHVADKVRVDGKCQHALGCWRGMANQTVRLVERDDRVWRTAVSERGALARILCAERGMVLWPRA